MTGASGFQTPITMPVLRHPDVPAVHTGTLVTYLLHRSEVIFPKLNLVGTVGNLAMAVAIYLNRNSASPAIKAANPYILASLGLSLGVSAYALTVMVPINTAMKNAAKVLKESPEDKDAEKTLRENQEKWQGWNMGMCAKGSLEETWLTGNSRPWLHDDGWCCCQSVWDPGRADVSVEHRSFVNVSTRSAGFANTTWRLRKL